MVVVLVAAVVVVTVLVVTVLVVLVVVVTVLVVTVLVVLVVVVTVLVVTVLVVTVLVVVVEARVVVVGGWVVVVVVVGVPPHICTPCSLQAAIMVCEHRHRGVPPATHSLIALAHALRQVAAIERVRTERRVRAEASGDGRKTIIAISALAAAIVAAGTRRLMDCISSPPPCAGRGRLSFTLEMKLLRLKIFLLAAVPSRRANDRRFERGGVCKSGAYTALASDA